MLLLVSVRSANYQNLGSQILGLNSGIISEEPNVGLDIVRKVVYVQKKGAGLVQTPGVPPTFENSPSSTKFASNISKKMLSNLWCFL